MITFDAAFERLIGHKGHVNITYGTLQGAFVSAVAYWLGSSNGSSEKQGMIGRMIRG